MAHVNEAEMERYLWFPEDAEREADTLTKEQREVEHMMTCRKNDCRRCDG